MSSTRAAEASPLLSPALPRSTHEEPLEFPPTLIASSSSSSRTSVADYKRSLLGFYLFSIASEVWIIAAGTLFLPVVIETYARANGRLSPEYESVCPPSGQGGGNVDEEGQVRRCAVRILFTWLDTASFSLIVYSMSVAVQALTVISIGVLADDPVLRHRFLLSFATLGSLASMAFILIPSTSPAWGLCTLFALVANVSFGATGVCLNSYLPSLARLSPTVSAAHDSLEAALSKYRHLQDQQQSSPRSTYPFPSTLNDASPNLPTQDDLLCASESLSSAHSEYSSLKSIETSRISSRAIAMGYAAGISVLVALLPIVGWLGRGGDEARRDETWPLRVAIAVSAMWWLFGSLVASRYLRPTISSLNADHSQSIKSRPEPLVTYKERKEEIIRSVKLSWVGLGKNLKEWRRLPMTFVFLSAWFLLSDSFATLTSTAMLFAKTTLNLPTASLIIVAILTPLSGILGSLTFPHLQHRHFLPSSNLSVLILLILLSSTIPLWGLVSLNSQAELFALSIWFGTLYGSFQSYSRTCFSELVPTSQSARWFGLYSITDKSSSFLGPLLVSIVTNQTGEIRHGFYLILSFFLLSIPILSRVNMEQGTKDVDKFERELERSHGGQDSYDEADEDDLTSQRYSSGDEEGG